MIDREENLAILMLEDGRVFKGIAAGKIGTTTGEICFNTGMTGYQEIFTDPSYYGQVLVATNVHIGNYGIRDLEVESDSIKIEGLVCRNFNIEYSRKMADQSIQQYFETKGIVGISKVDTRAVVRHIRDKGAMNCIISSEIFDEKELMRRLRKVPSMEGLELASAVTTSTPYFFGDERSEKRIAVMDYGVKRNILRCLEDRNCYLKIFPAQTEFEELMDWNPDAFFLSNGPGDPAAMGYAIETIRKMLESKKPLFGICLGHQLLAIALGLSTYKMHNGHRGINHPVQNLSTGRGEITSQNHGFGVSMDSMKENLDKVEVTHLNLNDGTIEGLRSKIYNAFSVQYHPEASPGPHDARYLFDRFVNEISLVYN